MPKMMMFSLAASGALVGAALVQAMHWRGQLAGAASSSCSSVRVFARNAWARCFATDTPKPAEPFSGNTSFDAYRADALRSMDAEQKEFEAFIEGLRNAEDRQAFENFLTSRRNPNGELTRR